MIADDGEMDVDTVQMPRSFRLVQREDLLASPEADRRGCCATEGCSLQSPSSAENTTTHTTPFASVVPHNSPIRGHQPQLLFAQSIHGQPRHQSQVNADFFFDKTSKSVINQSRTVREKTMMRDCHNLSMVVQHHGH